MGMIFGSEVKRSITWLENRCALWVVLSECMSSYPLRRRAHVVSLTNVGRTPAGVPISCWSTAVPVEPISSCWSQRWKL